VKELFEIEVSESPRLKWIRGHALRTHYDKDVSPGDECEISGEKLYPWVAFTGAPNFPRPDAGYGNTEDEALCDWAIKMEVRLWNEETLKVNALNKLKTLKRG
jgi:hypothetical protein